MELVAEIDVNWLLKTILRIIIIIMIIIIIIIKAQNRFE
jgi:hypothetical protein